MKRLVGFRKDGDLFVIAKQVADVLDSLASVMSTPEDMVLVQRVADALRTGRMII